MGRSAKVIRFLCFAAVATVASVLPAAEPRIVGGQFNYTVRRGDTLGGLVARFTVNHGSRLRSDSDGRVKTRSSPDAESLARRNGLSPRQSLRAGRVLRVDNRHIVPSMLENGILINVPQRLLFYFENGRLQTAARAVGLMQAAFEAGLGYAQDRNVFGKPIFDYQLSKVKLAKMAALICAGRQFSYDVARKMLHGGMGYAEEFPVSRYFVDARVLSIFEGADETLCLRVIARRLTEQALSA